jgi:hypothetical protein
MGLVNHNPTWSTRANSYDFTIKFDTNNTSAPDGVDPSYGTDCAVARSGVGTFTITFAASKKPYALLWGDAEILGDEPTLDAQVEGYVQSTGVLTVSVISDGGTPAVAETTDKTVQVFCKFSISSQNDS